MRSLGSSANAWRLAFFTAAIYVAALTIGSSLLYYLAYVLAGVLISAFIWSRLNRMGVQVMRHVHPPSAQVGQYVEELVEVRNQTPIRKLWLEIRDQSTLGGHQLNAVVSLPGRAARRWRVRTRCMKRGLFRLGPTAILTGDPFGLFQTSMVAGASAELLVYPPTIPLSQFKLPASELPGGSRTQHLRFQTTPTAAGIREYQPGDPMNRIHWPVTARLQKLMVKEFELDPTSDIWLLLDLDSSVQVHSQISRGYSRAAPTPAAMIHSQHGGTWLPQTEPELLEQQLLIEPSTEEYAVTVTASLASFFIGEGRSVGLISWGQHKVVLPADRGGRQLVKILRALAVLRAEGTAPIDEVIAAERRLYSRQDTLVVVTPSLSSDWVSALELEAFKGISAAAVIVEPSTFGATGSPLMLVSALSGMNIPTYLVKRDDSIDAALSQQYAGPAPRNLR